jgi:hypothetical protein
MEMAIGVRKSESAAKPECLSHANYYVINSSDMCYAVNYYAGGFQKKKYYAGLLTTTNHGRDLKTWAPPKQLRLVTCRGLARAHKVVW